MRAETNKPCYIMAFNEKKKEGDREAIQQYLGLETGEYKELLGKYTMAGSDCDLTVSEYSYLFTEDMVTFEQVMNVAKEFEQESVLFLDNQRNAYLLYLSQEDKYPSPMCGEYLGRFIEVSKEIAEDKPAFTFDPTTNKYYIVR